MTASSTTPKGSERRTAPRSQPALGTICRLDHSTEGGPDMGLVWDISQTGISMLTPAALDAGVVVAGELTTVEGGDALPVLLRVVHCRRVPTGDFAIGAQFFRRLSAGEMTPFLPPTTPVATIG